MSPPLLAICIPTYNRSAALGRLLERLHEELGDDTDVVVQVSDNASPDDTQAVLAAMSARMPNLRVHRQETNVGPEGNYRWLIGNAPECDYLWCFGDDDEPEPGALAYVHELLATHRPAWLHLPHRFVHPDGRVKVESRRPDAPEVHADPGRMYVAQYHWLTFLSASIVRRDALRDVVAASSTESMYTPLIWFFLASLDGPCVVADRLLVTGSTDILWGERMVEAMTTHFVGMYDEALGRLVTPEEFGRSMDAHFNGDHYWCWKEAGAARLTEAVRRFPHSRVLRRYLWTLGRELRDPRCAAEVAAASAASGDDARARALVEEGEAAFGRGDMTAAAQLFTRALEEAPAFAEAWNDLAVALHAAGSPQARTAVATAMELDPDDENTRRNHRAIMAPVRAPDLGSASVALVFPDVPEPDRSAGHRRAFEMALAMRACGYDTTVAALRSHGFEVAAARLRAAGVHVHAADDGCDLGELMGRGFDVVIVAFHALAARIVPVVRALSPRTRVVVDSVDVHFLRMRREAELAGSPTGLARAEAVRQAELAAYRAADVVVAITPEEQDLLRDLLPGVPVEVIGNVHRPVGRLPGPEGRAGALFVGSFVHPPNADAVRFICSELLPELRARGYDHEVAVAGSAMPTDVRGMIAAAGGVALGFVPSVEEELAGRRVSLAPLRYGAGLKGKVGEAFACGVPVVGTSIAAEGFQGADAGMLVADTAAGLAAAVVRLTADDELWTRLSAGGAALVARTLGPDACEAAIRRIVETALEELAA
jgi:glycosyltransferase involved in cell wall biosynthesis